MRRLVNIRFFRRIVLGGGLAAAWCVILLGVMWGCADDQPAPQVPFLVKVGGRTLTVAAFNRVLEISKAAYSHNDLMDPEVLRDLKLRVVNQLIEEMILLEKSKALNITVTDEELAAEINRIKADYPEGVFDQMLIESAVSYETWKERLRVRLIAQKVIDTELHDKVRVTAKEIADYYRTHYGRKGMSAEGDGTGRPTDEEIVRQLKEKKTQAAYAAWIESSRQELPIEINTRQWDRVIGVH